MEWMVNDVFQVSSVNFFVVLINVFFMSSHALVIRDHSRIYLSLVKPLHMHVYFILFPSSFKCPWIYVRRCLAISKSNWLLFYRTLKPPPSPFPPGYSVCYMLYFLFT
jgi:hypothetical protein